MWQVPRLREETAVRCAGDRAFLLTPDDPERVGRLATELAGRPVAGVVDILPAAETVLVILDSVRSAARVRLSVSPTFRNKRRSVRSCLMFHHAEGGHI